MAVRSSNMGNITSVQQSYKSIVFNRGTLFNFDEKRKEILFPKGGSKWNYKWKTERSKKNTHANQ